MTETFAGKSRIFHFNPPTPACQKGNLRQPNEEILPVQKTSGVLSSKRRINFFNTSMRLYLTWCITHPKNPKDFREIKCNKCGKYEDLDFHHKKYAPKQKVYLNDIQILCCKCHRNSNPSKRKASKLRTIFNNGKRFCEVAEYKFEY